jgi:hypothetical protein
MARKKRAILSEVIKSFYLSPVNSEKLAFEKNVYPENSYTKAQQGFLYEFQPNTKTKKYEFYLTNTSFTKLLTCQSTSQIFK